MMMQTKNLKLVLRTPEQTRADVEGMDAATKALLQPEWLALLEQASSADPFIHGFAIFLQATDEAVGSCGFNGPPVEGVAEIAYSIDPDHQGKGYATEAADALARFAVASGRVHLVCAHTLPEANASGRVLSKCGFRNVGEVMHPQDGLIWRWEKAGESA